MDSTTLTLIIALVAVILTLVLALIALLRSKNALERTDRSRIESIANETISRYMGFEGGQKIRNIVYEELKKQQAKPITQTPVVPEAKPIAKPAEAEKVESVKPTEDRPVKPQSGPVEISRPDPVTLFTGSYSTGAFRHITSIPDDKTVFTIYTESADAYEGVLNIDESAYEKVAQTPDYLRNACSYSGAGTRLRVIQTGKVVKENGTWVVKEPIIADFN